MMRGVKTREQIQALADETYLGASEAPLIAYYKMTFIACQEYINGLPIDQKCPECGNLVEVSEISRGYQVDCRCGHCGTLYKPPA
jgi:predicted RNA-binding Zn-ribbon protein involved in translation (DUF1610 family)